MKYSITFNEDGTFDINGVSEQKKHNLLAQRDFNTIVKYVGHWIEHCYE